LPAGAVFPSLVTTPSAHGYAGFKSHLVGNLVKFGFRFDLCSYGSVAQRANDIRALHLSIEVACFVT
jgi:hypothetical protein